MQSEHAHMDLNYGIHNQPKVSFAHHVESVANKAISKIPGGAQLVKNTFKKGAWQKPFALPGKRYINQAMHLGF